MTKKAQTSKKKSNYRKLLRDAGLRHTEVREKMLSVLDRRDYHPTPEELYQRLKKRGGIGLSTVYLNIHTLGKRGIIRELKGPKGEMRIDGWQEPHVHLVDYEKGIIRDLPLEEVGFDVADLLQRVQEKAHWDIRWAHIQLIGFAQGGSPEETSAEGEAKTGETVEEE